MIDIVTIATPGLGNRSYIAHDGTVAVAIDPPRDIDRVLNALADRGVRLTHVFETHVHNDYVTGGLELSRRTGATYVLAAGEEITFDHHPISDGDELTTGGLRIRAMHTPGHTPQHHTYVLLDGDRPVAAFTGGSLLYGTVGRTDLIDTAMTEQLTRAQFRSARRMADALPDDVEVRPTHGFGSFCSSGPASDVDTSTLGAERQHNAALTVADEEAFVELIVGGLGAYPRYYAHMGPANRSGPSPLDLSPPVVVDPVELRGRIHDGQWVVDVRNRIAFADGHLAGTINMELDDSLATYLGWTVPWGMPVTLVGDTANEVARAQRMIARIGIDRPAGQATGGVQSFGAGGDIRAYETATFEDLAKRCADGWSVHVLDVRGDDEWAEGHVEGAQHIPLYELDARMHEVPGDRPNWVHCATGYRSSIAASLLDRAGKPVVLVVDDWDTAAEAGVPVTR